MISPFHEPVLRDETLQYLRPERGGTYVDCTTGGGGHSAALCDLLGADGRLICLDADAEALDAARSRLAACAARVEFVQQNFRRVGDAVRALGAAPVHGVLFDLGVSSYQLDETSRGFSFRSDAPLDMRMDRRGGVTAHDLVNGVDERELARILYEYGEERHARRIARALARVRPLRTTGELREAVAATAGGGPALTKTLARVFQALRIAVNDELAAVEEGLEQALGLLAPGGRMAVIAYHSLEDRRVKEFFRRESAAFLRAPQPFLPDTPLKPRLRVLTRKPVQPTAEEVERNPRARSARLRAAERTAEG